MPKFSCFHVAYIGPRGQTVVEFWARDRFDAQTFVRFYNDFIFVPPELSDEEEHAAEDGGAEHPG